MTSHSNLSKIIWIFVSELVFAPLVASHLKVERNFTHNILKDFKIVWNVQTELCEGFGVHFMDFFKKFGIIANANDSFRGENITLLYNIGDFPTVTKGHLENGGIPQDGDISKHLDKLRKDIEKMVPKNFKGFGVIDFEDWRPIFRQNWNSQKIYRNMSLMEAEKNHPDLPQNEINRLSKTEFEASAKLFMSSTLKEVKKLRPHAKWGYYGFPYCLNFRDSKNTSTCPDLVVKENNQLKWMFNESDAFYPSLYLNNNYTLNQHVEFMIGKLNEGFRVSSMVGFRPIYTYISFTYLDDTYLTPEDMFLSLEVPKYYQMGGVIIWAKSSVVNSQAKCKNLLKYLEKVLGPILHRMKGNEYIIHKGFEDKFLRTTGISKDHWAKLAKAFIH